TIIAGNASYTGPDLYGSLGSLGHNLIGNTSHGSGFHETDLLNVDPLLGPLKDNGGPTLTHALLPGSPAIDAGDNSDAPEWDQRGPGYPRIVNDIIDIGAFEVQTGNGPEVPAAPLPQPAPETPAPAVNTPAASTGQTLTVPNPLTWQVPEEGALDLSLPLV